MTKRLSLFNGLPPYPGGKRRLTPWIFARLSEHIPPVEWSQLTFLDAFLGGGAVSLYAKSQGFQQLLANDWSDRSQIVGHALLRNQSNILNEVDWRLIAACEPRGEIRADFSPHTFSARHADLLEQIRQAAAQTQDATSKALYQLLLWHLAGDFVCFGSSIGTDLSPVSGTI